MTIRMSRRRLIIAGAGTVALAGLGWAGAVLRAGHAPLALVYRGPAASAGCPEAVAALLRNSPAGFRTEYCGPDEDRQISPEVLATAVLYAQPGGGELQSAWRRMRRYAQDIRDFVHGGGHYLGFCLGAYLAGGDPGLGLLPGKVSQYIASAGASVRGADDTIVEVRWRGQPRHMFFQDGPTFTVRSGEPATVLATYGNGAAAAVVTHYGAGQVGLVGPHPEADRSWYADARLTNPDGIRFDLGHDLIETTIQSPTAAR
jgi:glutamine amidotransferase-like uncharacterized protein